VRSNSARVGVGAVGIAVLTVAAAACGNGPVAEHAVSSTETTAVAAPPTIRQSCVTAVPAVWQQAIDASAVDTGGVSNVPFAVGRRGEVAVARDDGDIRDLVMIDADKSVSDIYAVPQPEQNQIGSVEIDDRWVVVGVQYAPRGANGIIPMLMRIDVVDRQGGPVRTVVESPMQDRTSGGQSIDSFALFGGKVYWITRDTYAGDTGTVRSYDLNTGVVAEVASGEMRNVRTTAAGLSWEVAWDQNTGSRAELKIPDALPPPVAGEIGTGRDQFTLVSDGNAYAWSTESGQGAPGLAYWSPKSGLVRITGGIPPGGKHQALPLHVVGPYIVIERGRDDQMQDTSATLVDSRSGALTYLRPSVGGANGGTIALAIGATRKQLPTAAGVIRVDALPPLSC
jgi:hypothetical protein